MEKKGLGPEAKKEYVKPVLSKNEPLTDITFASGTTSGGGGTTSGGTTSGGTTSGGTTSGGTTSGTTTGTTIPGTGGSPGTVL